MTNQATNNIEKIKPYDDSKSRRRIESLRAQLLAEVVRFVQEGATSDAGNGIPSRVAEGSNLSGIPRSLIDVVVRR